MNVFKFGGASVKDADGIRNVAEILRMQPQGGRVVIISAMGKTTNALEAVVRAYADQQPYQELLQAIVESHLQVAAELFTETDHPLFAEIQKFFDEVIFFLERNKSPDYNFIYDQVVSSGEWASSKILSAYLNSIGFKVNWSDVRDYIKTDNTYREANVNWAETESRIQKLDRKTCYITQGFIGSDANNYTVTLGREGSDYSAAIFAYCLGADSMTIWKDVPGVMTGDPRKFKDVELLTHISYEEAIEMAYYGASVIHPKTLQPLQQKNIPFFVRSFVKPEEAGTRVGSGGDPVLKESFILKENQHFLRIATRDFSFIAEEHMSLIFSLLAKYKIKISLMQNSAISLDLCVEDLYDHTADFARDLEQGFEIQVTDGVSLFTIRNANLEQSNQYYLHRNVLLEQISRKTVQVVIK